MTRMRSLKGTVIALTGEVDAVANGGRMARIANGHPWMSKKATDGSDCSPIAIRPFACRCLPKHYDNDFVVAFHHFCSFLMNPNVGPHLAVAAGGLRGGGISKQDGGGVAQRAHVADGARCGDRGMARGPEHRRGDAQS